MRITRYRRTIFIVLLILISMTVGAVANSQLERVEAFIRNDFKVKIDGIGSNIGPVLIYKDRSYLPVDLVARAVGSNVYWEDKTKTIHINNRVQGQLEQEPDDSLIMETIKPHVPQIFSAKYLGNEQIVLSNSLYSNGRLVVYYREKDIQRLGIVTTGLIKTIEEGSKDIYISEDELAKNWKEKPAFTYVYTTAIIGVTDPEKIRYITEFIDSVPAMEEAIYNRANPDPYSNQYMGAPSIYAVDFISDNEVNILFSNYDKFGKYTLAIKKNVVGKWYYTEYKKIFY